MSIFRIFQETWISNRMFSKSSSWTINTLYFLHQHVEIYIPEVFGNFWTTFSKVRFFNTPQLWNFQPFFDHFGFFLRPFSYEVRPLEVIFGRISSITAIIFPESPIEMWQCLGFFWRKLDFGWGVSKILLPDHKHAIFFA